MKKILATIIGILCIVSFANGQQRGDKYINGIIGVSTNSTIFKYAGNTQKENPKLDLLFGAGFAFFPVDRLRIELDAMCELQTNYVYYDYSFGFEKKIDKQLITISSIGPSIAYYVPITNTFYYTPQLDIGGVLAKYNIKKSSSPPQIHYGFALGLSPVNFEFRPTEHFGMNVNIMSLIYAYLYYKDLDVSSHSIGFNLCVNPSIGFKYYF